MKVRPALANNCFSCHTSAKMGDLVMDSREALLRGGQSGPAVRPGDPDGSLLIQAVRQTHDRIKMPPGGRLPASDIEALERWIRDGAEWPEHASVSPAPAGLRIGEEQRAWWAFQPVRKPDPPPVKDEAWARTTIDRFVLARLERENLRPVRPADRRTLIRRASYDLTGLPPTPAEVDAFVADRSAEAFEKVVDRLLASPRYGERWGRYWLDIARYSDDKLNSTQDEPQPNVWRYRDWVIQAFNDDMPYDLFVKAQIVGDRMGDKEKYVAGLGFFANSPQFQEDRVDALGRGFLALTVACAQCHDHKFDPIPTRDYYSLLGIFRNTRADKFPLAPPEVVEAYESRKKAADERSKAVREFEDSQAKQLAEILAAQSPRYLKAVRALADLADERAIEEAARSQSLDRETLARWARYLGLETHEHPFLQRWREAAFDDGAFTARLLAAVAEKKRIDRENLIRLGGKDDDESVRVIEVLSLERDQYFLWRDLVSNERFGKFDSGILYYRGEKIDRFLAPQWKEHLAGLRAERDRLSDELPEEYPFLMSIADVEKPKPMRVHLRGSEDNLGEEAPPQFLTVLGDGEPRPFTNGSGRLELANAIASPENPLTARVAVNRIWGYHFGRPIVGTPGNFGKLGEAPTHPELLDYLAARLVELKWSQKALHREIMLSNAYALSAQSVEPNRTKDPDNKLVWRANRQRLDVEPMRDTLLFVSGELDERRGGEALEIGDDCNLRRTVYGFVSRRRLDSTLALFDFPNPVATSDARIHTATPLQQLYFLNSEFIQERAGAFALRLRSSARGDRERIREAYRILLQREPLAPELRLGLTYLASGQDAWRRYAQVLLSSNELLFVD
ncbi:MAG: PSD1 domain-containing protein [Bryobacteraceae bacterium]|nr:PSD1 domain-containing protein [Bryobacteraceae bacterium]